MGGRIPRSFVDELLTRTDVVEVIAARVPLRKAGQNFTARCPFHSEKTPSFTVSPAKQFYHCFGCGAHGTAISFLMEHDKLSFPEAVAELARAAGLEVPAKAGGERAVDAGIYELMQQADRYFQAALRGAPQGHRALAYLKQRRLSEEVTATFGVGYAPDAWDGLLRHMGEHGVSVEALVGAGLVVHNDSGRTYDRFRDRIMFPICDRRGRTIAFGGRVLGEATPKYLNSPETAIFHKGRTLYGLHQALAADGKPERLLLVEGYMDVVALAQFGIRYAVAALGTSATREHLQAAYRVAPTLVFCFDGDRAGQMAARRAMTLALPLMEDGREARFLILPEGEDPDSLVRREGAEAFVARVAAALPLSELLIQQLREGIDLSAADGRARLLDRARPMLAEMPAGALKALLTESLAHLTHLQIERIGQLLDGGEAPRGSRRPVAVNRTLVRHGIALLLHRPALAAEVEIPADLATVPEPGAQLLSELLEIARRSPHLPGAALVERYRDSGQSEALARLCEWQPEIPEAQLGIELAETLRLLKERHAPRRVILDKLARGEPVTEAEREALRRGSEPRGAM